MKEKLTIGEFASRSLKYQTIWGGLIPMHLFATYALFTAFTGASGVIIIALGAVTWITTHTLDAICELFPQFTRMRMLRSWGGIVDVTPDRSPIIGKTPVENLFVNCGWGTGGFKATPGSGHVFAHTLATGEPHKINAPFTLDRFRTGRLIDEAAAAAVAH